MIFLGIPVSEVSIVDDPIPRLVDTVLVQLLKVARQRRDLRLVGRDGRPRVGPVGHGYEGLAEWVLRYFYVASSATK